MFRKILAFFKLTNKPDSTKASKSTQPKPQPRKKPKIEASRIGELGEYKINIQLDQLPKNTKYISDIMVENRKSRTGYSQIDHAVISPHGIFVIETKNYNGEIKGSRTDKNWRVGRFNMYNPLLQNYGHIKALEQVLSEFPGLLFISMVSFTMRCRFSIDPELRNIQSNELVVYDTELSDFISRKLNRIQATTEKPMLSAEEVQKIYEAVLGANITDADKRAEHIRKIKEQSTK